MIAADCSFQWPRHKSRQQQTAMRTVHVGGVFVFSGRFGKSSPGGRNRLLLSPLSPELFAGRVCSRRGPKVSLAPSPSPATSGRSQLRPEVADTPPNRCRSATVAHFECAAILCAGLEWIQRALFTLAADQIEMGIESFEWPMFNSSTE